MATEVEQPNVLSLFEIPSGAVIPTTEDYYNRIVQISQAIEQDATRIHELRKLTYGLMNSGTRIADIAKSCGNNIDGYTAANIVAELEDELDYLNTLGVYGLEGWRAKYGIGPRQC